MARRRKPRSDMRVYLHDEAPRVGTGWRGVKIKTIGRKWAHLVETSSDIGFKVPVRVWESMKRHGRGA